MAHKLSLADVVNVLQKFMTFHLHRFHSSVLSVHTSGRKRQYLPKYRTHLKKKRKKKATSRSFVSDYICTKEDSLCFACRFIEFWYQLSSTGDLGQNFTSTPSPLSPQFGSNWLQRPFQLFWLYLCNSKE